MRRFTTAGITALVLAMTAPGIAGACNIQFRTVGPFDVKRHDLRRPTIRAVEPQAWSLDATWTSVEPQLNQVLRTRRIGSYVNVGFAAQRTLSIDALPPDTYGWKWIDDEDPATTCALAGQHEWETPTVLVAEGRREIRILAVSRRTPGDSNGCEIQDGSLGLPCPNLTTSMVRLSRPIGSRRIVFEQFGTSSDDASYSSSSSGRT